ncbi:Uncharacterised protein [Bordetella pertussis]|nr:Uncharacterised protein [Bordetella pertussis]CFW46975.1 Uncharacterised protein [Bordetella pertussis]
MRSSLARASGVSCWLRSISRTCSFSPRGRIRLRRSASRRSTISARPRMEVASRGQIGQPASRSRLSKTETPGRGPAAAIARRRCKAAL